MLVGCVGVYGERVDEAKLVVEKLRPTIDRYIVIVDETVTEEQKSMLEALGCKVYFHPWEDSMVKMRNQYLDKLKIGDWAIVHDPDECFNEVFCKDVRLIIEDAEEREVVKKYYGWGRTFRSRPIFVDHSTNRYRVPGICILDNQPNFPPGYSLEDAKATVDKAILEKKGLVLAFHRIFKERGSFITAEADFVGLCEYVMLQIRNESLECL
ncbi:unnamed protein product, partial [marine sediment metagenome]